MDSKTYRDSIRSMLDHENDLVNNRYTWMLATQSLLFAALGTFWKKDLLVESIICAVGLISTSSVGYVLYLANRAIWNLVNDWVTYCKAHPDTANFPPIYGLKREWTQWPFPWLLIPPIVTLAWIGIIIRRLTIGA